MQRALKLRGVQVRRQRSERWQAVNGGSDCKPSRAGERTSRESRCHRQVRGAHISPLSCSDAATTYTTPESATFSAPAAPLVLCSASSPAFALETVSSLDTSTAHTRLQTGAIRWEWHAKGRDAHASKQGKADLQRARQPRFSLPTIPNNQHNHLPANKRAQESGNPCGCEAGCAVQAIGLKRSGKVWRF